MSHTGVEVFDFLFYTIYPVIGIFLVEVISRLTKAPKWINIDIKSLKGEVVALPDGDDIERGIESQLITEYYSK